MRPKDSVHRPEPGTALASPQGRARSRSTFRRVRKPMDAPNFVGMAVARRAGARSRSSGSRSTRRSKRRSQRAAAASIDAQDRLTGTSRCDAARSIHATVSIGASVRARRAVERPGARRRRRYAEADCAAAAAGLPAGVHASRSQSDQQRNDRRPGSGRRESQVSSRTTRHLDALGQRSKCPIPTASTVATTRKHARGQTAISVGKIAIHDERGRERTRDAHRSGGRNERSRPGSTVTLDRQRQPASTCAFSASIRRCATTGYGVIERRGRTRRADGSRRRRPRADAVARTAPGELHDAIIDVIAQTAPDAGRHRRALHDVQESDDGDADGPRARRDVSRRRAGRCPGADARSRARQTRAQSVRAARARIKSTRWSARMLKPARRAQAQRRLRRAGASRSCLRSNHVRRPMFSRISGTLARTRRRARRARGRRTRLRDRAAAVRRRRRSRPRRASASRSRSTRVLNIDGNSARATYFGFTNAVERDVFRSVDQRRVDRAEDGRARVFRADVGDRERDRRGDHVYLATLPGIGQQKARDIVAKLQGKVARFLLIQDAPPVPAPAMPDFATRRSRCLLQLEYKRTEAEAMVRETLAAATRRSTTPRRCSRRSIAARPSATHERRRAAQADLSSDDQSPTERVVVGGRIARRRSLRRLAAAAHLRRLRRSEPGRREPSHRDRRRAAAAANRSNTSCSTDRRASGKRRLPGSSRAKWARTSGPTAARRSKSPRISSASLTSLEDGDVLFIDEIHRLGRVVEEFLYPAMEDFQIDFVVDRGAYAKTLKLPLKRFTLVGATTRAGMLSAPLRDRFGIVHHLDYYEPADLERIVMRSAQLLGRADRHARVRARSRRAAAARRASRTGCCAACATSPKCAPSGAITHEVADEALAREGVDRAGSTGWIARFLTRIDRERIAADRPVSPRSPRR